MSRSADTGASFVTCSFLRDERVLVGVGGVGPDPDPSGDGCTGAGAVGVGEAGCGSTTRLFLSTFGAEEMAAASVTTSPNTHSPINHLWPKQSAAVYRLVLSTTSNCLIKCLAASEMCDQLAYHTHITP